MNETLIKHYKALRKDGFHPASRCLGWARNNVEVDELESEIEYEFIIEEEDVDPRGDFSDARNSQYVLDQIESGNEFAWFCAKVTVSHLGEESDQYLGCCSYKDFEDFKYGGYFADMLEEGKGECEALALSDQSGEH